MDKKIFITGANGLLGQWLLKALVEEDFLVVASGKGECRIPFHGEPSYKYIDLDITDGNKVNEIIIAEKPDLIVHAAAITQPDVCEINKILCWNTNVTATRFLIDAAKKINAGFIYVSTDFVFSGEEGPYSETDEPAPVNYYGSSKLAGEKATEESGLPWTIIRTVLVYGKTWKSGRKNFVYWIRESLENKVSIRVVDDQWRTPTFVEDLADGIVSAIKKGATGIFHLSGKDMMTPYQLAMKTAETLQLDPSYIERVNASVFSQPAKRPAKTGFVIEKAIKELGFKPNNIDDGLQKMFTETEEYAG